MWLRSEQPRFIVIHQSTAVALSRGRRCRQHPSVMDIMGTVPEHHFAILLPNLTAAARRQFEVALDRLSVGVEVSASKRITDQRKS